MSDIEIAYIDKIVEGLPCLFDDHPISRCLIANKMLQKRKYRTKTFCSDSQKRSSGQDL